MPRKPNIYKLLECFECGQQFGRKLFNLKRHLKLHYEELIRVKCTVCNKTYQNNANYKAHWITKHRGKIKKPESVDCATPSEPKPKKKRRYLADSSRKDDNYAIIGISLRHFQSIWHISPSNFSFSSP